MKDPVEFYTLRKFREMEDELSYLWNLDFKMEKVLWYDCIEKGTGVPEPYRENSRRQKIFLGAKNTIIGSL